MADETIEPLDDVIRFVDEAHASLQAARSQLNAIDKSGKTVPTGTTDTSLRLLNGLGLIEHAACVLRELVGLWDVFPHDQLVHQMAHRAFHLAILRHEHENTCPRTADGACVCSILPLPPHAERFVERLIGHIEALNQQPFRSLLARAYVEQRRMLVEEGKVTQVQKLLTKDGLEAFFVDAALCITSILLDSEEEDERDETEDEDLRALLLPSMRLPGLTPNEIYPLVEVVDTLCAKLSSSTVSTKH